MIKKILPIAIMIIVAGVTFTGSLMYVSSLNEGKKTGDQVKTDPVKTSAEQEHLNNLANAGKTELLPEQQQLDELIKDIRAKKKQLEKRERDLDLRERQFKLATEDLQRQSQELEKLRIDLVAALTPLKSTKSEILRFRTLIRNQEIANLQNAAKMWAKMEPANVARMVVEMFRNNQGKSATKIIRYLPEKNWAAIMDEVTNMDVKIQKAGSSAKEDAAMKIIVEQLKVIRDTQPKG